MAYNILLRKNGERRVLDIPSEEEKREQRLLLSYLAPGLESSFSKYSYGYMRGRSPQDLVRRLREYVDNGLHWVACIDVEDCFGSIDPSDALGLIDSRIEDYFSEYSGLPQGHPLSPMLCNIYLDLFDKEMERHVQLSQIKDLDFRFLRYADDVWLLTRNKKALELYTSLAVNFLKVLGFNSRAPTVRHVNQGVDVLGFTVRRWTIGPSAKSLKRLHDRLIQLICRYLELMNEAGQVNNTNKHADNTTTHHNHIETGWSNYYGQDAYTQAMEQWETLNNWIAMMDESGATPRSDTKHLSGGTR